MATSALIDSDSSTGRVVLLTCADAGNVKRSVSLDGQGFPGAVDVKADGAAFNAVLLDACIETRRGMMFLMADPGSGPKMYTSEDFGLTFTSV